MNLQNLQILPWIHLPFLSFPYKIYCLYSMTCIKNAHKLHFMYTLWEKKMQNPLYKNSIRVRDDYRKKVTSNLIWFVKMHYSFIEHKVQVVYFYISLKLTRHTDFQRCRQDLNVSIKLVSIVLLREISGLIEINKNMKNPSQHFRSSNETTYLGIIFIKFISNFRTEVLFLIRKLM